MKNLKLKMLIFGFFRTKTKKLLMDSERKWKVCFIKVHLFLLKNACGASYKPFYIFFVVPLRGHFRHASPVRILILFFLFFHWQLTADLSERYGIIFKLFWFSRRLIIHRQSYLNFQGSLLTYVDSHHHRSITYQ